MRLISTRNPRLAVGFVEAVLANLPGDGGLFAPAELAPWPDVPALLGLPWRERSIEILDRLLTGELARADLEEIVGAAFDFPLPLVEVDEHSFALELFHGPSLAFKDFGARFLAEVLERIGDRPSLSIRTILTATSGDTGAAVAAAFRDRPGVRVAVLYPAGRVSPLQERQLACIGGNVRAFAVAGTFDDCQRLVKGCFSDPGLSAELGLTSANSINIARLLAQILYYFEALAQLGRHRPGCRPVVAVPSGNFGNLCAGLYARALGLPVAALVAATNANRTVPDYLDGGSYLARPSLATMSNAMDVGDPSNWERIEHLLAPARETSDAESAGPAGSAAAAGSAARAGEARAGLAGIPGPTASERAPESVREALRTALRWGSLDDGATAAVLRGLWAHGYQADPHGAVAYGVLARALEAGETGIFLATAHPAKFQPALARLGLEPALPPRLQALLDCPLRSEMLTAELDSLKTRLRSAETDTPRGAP
jgi:threonine synthase